MNRSIVLDAGPLGLLTTPKRSERRDDCILWAESQIRAGTAIFVPEIADYEVRRELMRAGKSAGLENLDRMGQLFAYIPITTVAMRAAARLWAVARQSHFQTAPDAALDADVILAAQVISLGLPDVIVASTNPGHLARFVAADLWDNILA